MNRTYLRSYRRAVQRHGETVAKLAAGTIRRAAAAAVAAATGGSKASLETLENRSLMSVSALGGGAASDTGTGPQALDVSLQHPSVASSNNTDVQTTDTTDKQQAKAARKAEKDAARAEKKAARLAAKEAKQAAKESSQDDTDDASKAEKRAAREAAKAEKAAARAERKAERNGHKEKVAKTPSKAPSNSVPAITGLTLVNARTNSDFVPLANGATVDLAQVGSRYLSVRADTAPGVESVSFEVDGDPFYTDSGGTFSLRGGKGSNYRGWRATNGEHTLKITPHSRNGARGDAGESVTMTFNVTGAPVRNARHQNHQQNPTPDTGGDDDNQQPTPPPPSSGAPTPVPPPSNGGGNVIVPPSSGTGNVVLPPTPVPARPSDPDETPAATNGINSSINVSIENFSGTVTTAGVGYFPIKANASGADVVRVEFYANDHIIGAANAQPYMIGWSNVPQGSYDVVAKAIDKNGGYKISEVVRFNIVAAPQGQTITVTPGQSIQDAADRAEPGDTIVVMAGTYKESVKVSSSGTAAAPITFQFEEGAVIDASGESEAFVANGGSYIVVKGLEVKGCDNELQGQNAAVRTGDHWRLEDVEVHHVLMTGVGVMGKYVTLVRVNVHDNGQNGISSPRGQNVLMIDCKSIHNNTDEHSPQSEGGGGKWARVNNVFITGFETANNIGPGLWFDINNTNFVVKNSVAHGNTFKDSDKQWQGAGFKTEISQGPMRFENNLTYDNTGAGLSIEESEGVTITGNTLRNDPLEFRNYLRNDGDWKLENVTVTGNTFIGSSITTSNAGTRFDTNSPSKMHLTVDGNTYDAGGTFLEWSGKRYNSLEEMTRSLGFEQHGRVVDGATLAQAA